MITPKSFDEDEDSISAHKYLLMEAWMSYKIEKSHCFYIMQYQFLVNDPCSQVSSFYHVYACDCSQVLRIKYIWVSSA